MTASILPSAWALVVVPPQDGRPWSAPAWVESPRDRTVRSHDPEVGQASDQVSVVVGEAGAGSLRALRGVKARPDGRLRVGHSRCQRQPAMPGRDEGDWVHRRGRPVTIRATLPASADLAPEPRQAQQAASQLRTEGSSCHGRGGHLERRLHGPGAPATSHRHRQRQVLQPLRQPHFSLPNYMCTWSWTCCYGGRRYRCIEHNRYISNCTSSCTGVGCSRIRDIGSC
jgi:hypothetical protein